MELLGVLLVLGLVVVILVLPIVATVRSSRAMAQAEAAQRLIQSMSERLRSVEEAVHRLSRAGPPEPASPAPAESAAAAPLRPAVPSVAVAPPSAEPPPIRVPPPTEAPLTPDLAVSMAEAEVPTSPSGPVPPPLAAPALRPSPPRLPPVPSKPLIQWEQFMGVKLAGWLAGLALFLGAAFYIKYAFENNLISPPIRVASGFLLGLGLVFAGLRIPRERYAVGVQVLTSAGILILYADAFAACSFYHFIGGGVAFALMALITAVAFLLAVRLNAPAVAILALLGGFLTPILLSSGRNRPVELFSYLALLDAGLVAVALRKRWNYLALLGAAATVLMQYGWMAKFFSADQVVVAMAIYLGYAVLFGAAVGLGHRWALVDRYLSGAAVVMAGSAWAFALYLLTQPYPEITARPWLLFGFVFLVDAVLLALAGLRTELRPMHLAAGGVAFLLLMIWTVGALRPELLNAALAIYLLFAVLHSVYPVVIERLRPGGTPAWWANGFAPMTLLLILVPIFKLTELSFLLWPVILLVDVLAIGLAVLTCSLVAILGVLLLTLLAMAVWIAHVPAVVTGVPAILLLVGGFAVFFFVVGILVTRTFATRFAAEGGGTGASPGAGVPAWLQLDPELARLLVPALSALLPFLLLAFVLVRLPLADPSAVFGLAIFLTVLLLGVVWLCEADWVMGAGLAGVALIEMVWQFGRFTPASAGTTLAFYLAFYALFLAFPFVFAQRTRDRVVPWAVAALAGPVQFYFVYRLITAAYRNPYLGLVPAAFAVPSLLALVRMLQVLPAGGPRRNAQLAFFGGVALFFITLIIPIQFEKQWITVGWALEGAALLWLLHRVPHEGLKGVGVGLLLTAFVRLALNPAVLHYHARTSTPIFNWYLYAYGLVIACLFVGARLLAPPRDRLPQLPLPVPGVLQALGTVLAFLLMNLEIADYFSTGSTFTFAFSGSLARDMTYSLAWGVFALVLLVIGLRRRRRAPRYAGLALLVVTMIKLFLRDIWQLGGLYRIGSLIGLALVMLAVSFLYQRFLSENALKQPESPPNPPS